MLVILCVEVGAAQFCRLMYVLCAALTIKAKPLVIWCGAKGSAGS